MYLVLTSKKLYPRNIAFQCWAGEVVVCGLHIDNLHAPAMQLLLKVGFRLKMLEQNSKTRDREIEVSGALQDSLRHLVGALPSSKYCFVRATP